MFVARRKISGDDDPPFLHVEIVEDAIVTNTPAPTDRLQALDIAAERVELQGIERTLDANLILARKVCEVFSRGLDDEQSPVHCGAVEE